MRIAKEIAGNHQFTFSGYMFNPLSIPGVYDRKAARAVSKAMAKFNTQLSMPWLKMERHLVLQIITSDHCTMTMETKKAVWQVYSRILQS